MRVFGQNEVLTGDEMQHVDASKINETVTVLVTTGTGVTKKSFKDIMATYSSKPSTTSLSKNKHETTQDDDRITKSMDLVTEKSTIDLSTFESYTLTSSIKDKNDFIDSQWETVDKKDKHIVSKENKQQLRALENFTTELFISTTTATSTNEYKLEESTTNNNLEISVNSDQKSTDNDSTTNLSTINFTTNKMTTGELGLTTEVNTMSEISQTRTSISVLELNTETFNNLDQNRNQQNFNSNSNQRFSETSSTIKASTSSTGATTKQKITTDQQYLNLITSKEYDQFQETSSPIIDLISDINLYTNNVESNTDKEIFTVSSELPEDWQNATNSPAIASKSGSENSSTESNTDQQNINLNFISTATTNRDNKFTTEFSLGTGSYLTEIPNLYTNNVESNTHKEVFTLSSELPEDRQDATNSPTIASKFGSEDSSTESNIDQQNINFSFISTITTNRDNKFNTESSLGIESYSTEIPNDTTLESQDYTYRALRRIREITTEESPAENGLASREDTQNYNEKGAQEFKENNREGHVFQLETNEEKKYETKPACLTKKCYTTATRMIEHMDFTVDPCEDFYEYTCGSTKSDHYLNENWRRIESQLHSIKSNSSKYLKEFKRVYENCVSYHGDYNYESRVEKGMYILKQNLKNFQCLFCSFLLHHI